MFSHTYSLPVLSGVLLALVFFPFYLSALAFVALTPLFYFVATERHGSRAVFFGGFITGVIGIGPLVYLSLAQLTLFSDAEAFTFFIRACSVPATLLIGVLFGLVALLHRTLRSKILLLDSIVGASLYLLVVEVPLFWVFGGYYYGALSHTLSAFPGVLFLASLGGALSVSFLMVLGSNMLAEALVGKGVRAVWLLPLFIVLLWGSFFYIQNSKRSADENADSSLSVSVIQGGFDEYIEDAADAELAIYPLSLSRGLLSASEDEKIDQRLASLVPSSTTVLFWQTIAENENFYDEAILWHAGTKSSYKKQKLYALSDDYTPAWLRVFGIEKSSYVITPGPSGNTAYFEGEPIGILICSELHQVRLARTVSVNSPFLISIGSDSMFPGSLSGNFSLAAARLRAAENGIPVVRGNLLGPSAIIDPDGSLQEKLEYGEQGIVRGEVQLMQRGPTPYSRFGDAPLYTLSMFALLFSGSLAARRLKATALDMRG